jgi:hypothetical protein
MKAPNINENFVAFIDEFIDAETSNNLALEIFNRSEPDRRENYRFLGLGRGDMLEKSLLTEWDTNNVIQSTALYAFSFFKNLYNLNETFIFDRVFANIMEEGAFLPLHKDFSYSDTEEHDPTKKTFVAGLFLNDDYEGGNFEFFDKGSLTTKPNQGALVLFNGHSTLHGVQKITKNKRINILFMYYYADPEESN